MEKGLASTLYDACFGCIFFFFIGVSSAIHNKHVVDVKDTPSFTQNLISTRYSGAYSDSVRRLNVTYDGRVHCPTFPKTKWESWWVVLEDPEAENQSDRLVVLKRVNMRTGPQGGLSINRVTTRQQFLAPKREGRHVWKIHLYCDGCLGMDQTGDIQFDVMSSGPAL